VPTPDGPERRRAQRVPVERGARLRVAAGDLRLTGTIADIGSGGVFLLTRLLVEVGERGLLALDGERHEIPVCVVWTRGASHTLGPGLGLRFDIGDDQAVQRRALEMLLRLLDVPAT
jgi:hypothetical protein